MSRLFDGQLMLQGRECKQQNSQPVAADKTMVQNTTPAGMSRWALYRHRVTSRRALLELNDAELRDIGLDFRQARIEAMKPFWRE